MIEEMPPYPPPYDTGEPDGTLEYPADREEEEQP